MGANLENGACFSSMGVAVGCLNTSRPNRPGSSPVVSYLIFVRGQGTVAGDNREFKIRRLRTTATDKYATTHDQNHVTVHFSSVVLRLRGVVELFRVVGSTENILLVFCHLGNSRISSFRKKVFNSPALGEREAKYVSCV